MAKLASIVFIIFSTLLYAGEVNIMVLGRIKDAGEFKLSMEDAQILRFINKQGGFLVGGCPKHVSITRKENGGLRKISVDAYNIVMSGLEDIKLLDQDIVFIGEHVFPCMTWEEVQSFNKQLHSYIIKIEQNDDTNQI